MVAHRINISGGVLGGTHQQKIEGNQTLHCRSVILKTVCVQLKTIASEMTQKDGMKAGKTLPPVPKKGCVGISGRVFLECIMSSAMRIIFTNHHDCQHYRNHHQAGKTRFPIMKTS